MNSNSVQQHGIHYGALLQYDNHRQPDRGDNDRVWSPLWRYHRYAVAVSTVNTVQHDKLTKGVAPQMQTISSTEASNSQVTCDFLAFEHRLKRPHDGVAIFRGRHVLGTPIVRNSILSRILAFQLRHNAFSLHLHAQVMGGASMKVRKLLSRQHQETPVLPH